MGEVPGPGAPSDHETSNHLKAHPSAHPPQRSQQQLPTGSSRQLGLPRVVRRRLPGSCVRRDRFADLLGLTPNADLEWVLDFFELDRRLEGPAV